MRNYREFSALVGRTLTKITGGEVGDDEMSFECADGSAFRLYHDQDCCESVRLNEIVGDLADVVSTPILAASEESNDKGDPAPEHTDSWTWTFYRLQTIKGSVVLRWLGESNGYYSESVSFVQDKPAPGGRDHE